MFRTNLDFQGDLYAVTTDIDQKTDRELMNTESRQSPIP